MYARHVVVVCCHHPHLLATFLVRRAAFAKGALGQFWVMQTEDSFHLDADLKGRRRCDEEWLGDTEVGQAQRNAIIKNPPVAHAPI